MRLERVGAPPTIIFSPETARREIQPRYIDVEDVASGDEVSTKARIYASREREEAAAAFSIFHQLVWHRVSHGQDRRPSFVHSTSP